MFQIERHDKLVQYINQHKKANVNDLSRIFEVSKVTIRRDLDELASKGLIMKTHGGAVSIQSKLSYELPALFKSEINADAKKRIGAKAASLVDDGDIIIIDAGTTTIEMVPHLNQKQLTVLTNDIKIAMEIAPKANIELHVSGGMLNEQVYTLAGPKAAESFKEVHVNKTFLGCDALDVNYGITNRSLNEVEVKRAMIESAEEVVLVTDASKFNKRVFSYLTSLNSIHVIVTDQMSNELQEILEGKGIQVILA